MWIGPIRLRPDLLAPWRSGSRPGNAQRAKNGRREGGALGAGRRGGHRVGGLRELDVLDVEGVRGLRPSAEHGTALSNAGASLRLACRTTLVHHRFSSQILMNQIMSRSVRKTLSTQSAPQMLPASRQLADPQGGQFQAVLDEALRDYTGRQQEGRPRRHVLASFASSLEAFDSLYREMAK